MSEFLKGIILHLPTRKVMGKSTIFSRLVKLRLVDPLPVTINSSLYIKYQITAAGINLVDNFLE